VREQYRPAGVDPVVELDLALRGVGGEIGSDGSEPQRHAGLLSGRGAGGTARGADDDVGERRERVEAQHPGRVGDEVGRGVDVIRVDAAVARSEVRRVGKEGRSVAWVELSE